MLKDRENKGITLVALVVTIVILLILAGISISALTNTGIFQKAKDAKKASENAEKEQNAILSEYEKEMDQYGNNTVVSNFNSGKIKVGDYIKYEPDTITDKDENYESLISDLNGYSGSNTQNSLKQENLNWRVLDVKNGRIRLISEHPTESKITIYGYNGYNNAVYLIDKACSVFYSEKNYIYNVQNLKVEDVIEYMVNKPEDRDISYSHNNLFCPSMVENEKEQYVNGKSGVQGISEQEKLVDQKNENRVNVQKLKKTYWNCDVNQQSFKDNYYDLLVNNREYWLSSRCIDTNAYGGNFCIRYINKNSIGGYTLYTSNNIPNTYNLSYRPVITLNSNVQINTENLADGSSPEKAYIIY